MIIDNVVVYRTLNFKFEVNSAVCTLITAYLTMQNVSLLLYSVHCIPPTSSAAMYQIQGRPGMRCDHSPKVTGRYYTALHCNALLREGCNMWIIRVVRYAVKDTGPRFHNLRSEAQSRWLNKIENL